MRSSPSKSRRHPITRVVFSLFVLVVSLVGALLFRTFLLADNQPSEFDSLPVQLRPDSEVVHHFAGALRFQTLSPDSDEAAPTVAFDDLRTYLETAFPLLHANLRTELIGGGSLLFTWPGTDPSGRGFILLAHQDVVPVEAATAEDWLHPPFGGEVADGFVWGRGAVDDKSSVLAILEAVETLLATGFTPPQTIYMVFGHDEEIGGKAGARRVAEVLAERGVRADFALDEGSAIVEDVFPGVSEPVALIGLAEKGFVSLELVAGASGGHSSIPPRETAIDILAGAISNLRDSTFPSHLDGPTGLLFRSLAPRMSFWPRMVFGNLWLFGTPVRWVLALNPETDAAIRTTVVPTLLSSGTADNVIPDEARAVVNLRILPGETVEGALERVRKAVDDPRVSVRLTEGEHNDPTSVSRVDTDGYRRIAKAVTETFPGTIVAPFLSLGGTDSKHFASVADDVYRFAPDLYDPNEGVHGVNERISIESYLNMVRFYMHLIRDPVEG